MRAWQQGFPLLTQNYTTGREKNLVSFSATVFGPIIEGYGKVS